VPSEVAGSGSGGGVVGVGLVTVVGLVEGGSGRVRVGRVLGRERSPVHRANDSSIEASLVVSSVLVVLVVVSESSREDSESLLFDLEDFFDGGADSGRVSSIDSVSSSPVVDFGEEGISLGEERPELSSGGESRVPLDGEVGDRVVDDVGLGGPSDGCETGEKSSEILERRQKIQDETVSNNFSFSRHRIELSKSERTTFEGRDSSRDKREPELTRNRPFKASLLCLSTAL